MHNEELISLYYLASSEGVSDEEGERLNEVYLSVARSNLLEARLRLPEMLYEMVRKTAFHDWLITDLRMHGGNDPHTLEARLDITLQKRDQEHKISFLNIQNFQVRGKLIDTKIHIFNTSKENAGPLAEVMSVWFSKVEGWLECYILLPEKRYIRILCDVIRFDDAD